jgi:hypothetical protein
VDLPPEPLASISANSNTRQQGAAMKKLEVLVSKRRRVGALFALFLAAALSCAGVASAASPSLLSQFCESPGAAAGRCKGAVDIATDPVSGNVYVVDESNYRIDEFTIWGQFIKAFGGGVVNGGATGTGSLNSGSTVVNAISTSTKAFVPGMLIEGTGIAPGTTIANIEGGTTTLSQPATSAATGSPTALTSPEAPGNVPTNELQRITVTATAGSFNLSFRTEEPSITSRTTTTNIPYNASAAEVQSALEGLSNLGAGNVAVTSANPGGEAGVPGGPYTVEFKGARFADTDVRGLIVTPGTPPLSGGSAEVVPVRQGASAPEVCTGLDCRRGVDGNRAGQFAAAHGIAIDSSGDLYIYDSGGSSLGGEVDDRFYLARFAPHRVQKFDPEGNFLLMFGGEVNESTSGNICTAQDLVDGDICGGGKSGSGNGEFGMGPEALDSSSYAITAGAGDTIYVGGKDRIQKFDTNGNYTGQVALPEPGVPGDLAEDPDTGDLYFMYESPRVFADDGAGQVFRAEQPNVYKLNPNSGAVIGTPFKVSIPQRIAAANGAVYVGDEEVGPGVDHVLNNHPLRVLRFDSTGQQLETLFEGEAKSVSALATTSACGVAGVDLFVAGIGASGTAVRAYGSPPDPAVCPPPLAPPAISSQYAVSVGVNDATLRAKINPRFWPDATYYVQYGTGRCSEGGCDQEQPLAPGAKLTSAVTSQDVATKGVFLAGLSPNTTYHYRFVAQSSGGGPVRGAGGVLGEDGAEGAFNTFPAAVEARSDCPNQDLRIGASARLSDCRAYEMVSPVDKNGGDVAAGELNTFGTLGKASIDGERATFSSLRAFGNPQAGPLVDQYLSARGPRGWSTQSISPPRVALPFFRPIGETTQSKAFSEDLCSTWTLQDSDLALTPEAPPHVPNLYRRNNCGDGSYELLTTVAPPGFGAGEKEGQFYVPFPQGFSADESHTVFRATAALTSNACEIPGIYQVYVSSKEAPLRLVSALPPNKGGKATCTQTSAGTTGPGQIDGIRHANLSHAVSADASRIFWTNYSNPAPFASGETITNTPRGKLYVRINATEAPSKISGGECTQPEKACTLAISESNDALYWGASRNGDTAIYTVGDELFEFNVEEAKSRLIAKGVQGVVGESEDASRVYFISTNALSGSGANSVGNEAIPHRSNVYLAEGDTFTFVATLADKESLENVIDDLKKPSSPGSLKPYNHTARVSSDGLHLAFTSAQPLTGYDNTDVVSGEADAEAFLYDASPGGAGHIACISCNPSGARPTGRGMPLASSSKTINWFAALLPGWPEQLSPSRLLTNDGSRFFFNAVDALVPRDTNGKMDVYEWQRAVDAAGCKQAGAELFVEASGGCISLISSGQSADDSEVIDASAGGRDVFLATNSSLLPQDPGLYDVYDARTGGGYPPPPTPQPACEGEACQGPPAPPNDPTPASSSFEGAGNVVDKPARKKSHKKKHAKKKAHKQQKANHKRRAGR